MLTIREIKDRTERFFRERGVPQAKLDTDCLIAHSLQLKRLDLYLDLDRPLTEAQLADLRPLVKRRAAREPLQYIIGHTEFCGLRLKVDRRALIPRQETEELVELILERSQPPPRQILDLGTGCGALALALASRFPEASVVAVDSSAEALELALENAAALGLEDRVSFLEGSWYTPLASGAQFDWIVANPPYLTEAELRTAEPEVAEHEPHRALVAGPEGLDDLRLILGRARAHLARGGRLALETGIHHEPALTTLATEAGLRGEAVEDLSRRPRFFFAQCVD